MALLCYSAELKNDQTLAVPCVMVVFGLCLMCTSSLSQSTNTGSLNETNVPAVSSIEEEVLGPLRVWHIVFIVCSILLVIMIAVFCCVEIRVPRSRQEIEENYQKRLLNQRYVRILEKSPEELLRSKSADIRKPDVSVISSAETASPRDASQTPSMRRDWKQMTRRAVSKHSPRNNRDEDEEEEWQGSSKLGGKPPKHGRPTPLIVNPKDILAIMAQQKKTNP